jgi:hypothetical protein
MKILLDIKDSKALHLLELLKSLPYVKTTALTDTKAEMLAEFREAVEEMKQVLDGQKNARDADEFLRELTSP